MNRDLALSMLNTAILQIRQNIPNANGGTMQVGGAYWRLAQVLKDYLEPMLDEQEGKEHADFIRRQHGVLSTSPSVSAWLKS